MDSTGKDWFAKLADYIRECREISPLPARETPFQFEECQCQIIGGSLINWLKEVGPRFLQERSVLHKALRVEKDPFIIFTSNVAGLVAANEILAGDETNICFLYQEEFQNFLRISPDESYRWHIHVSSFFHEPIEETFLMAAKERFPIPSTSEYWQHSEFTRWGKFVGRGGSHLWEWDGTEPVLLEEAMESWVT